MAKEPTPQPSAARVERIPPHSEEAERGVLGAVLLDFERVMDLCIERQLKAEAFYIPAHRVIMEGMLALAEAHRPIDVLTLAERLKADGTLDRVGGAAFLNHLVDATPTAAHAEYYIESVRRSYLLRLIIRRAREAEAECHDSDESAEAVLGRIEQRFFDIGSIESGPVVPWSDIVAGGMAQVERFLNTKDGVSGLATGYRSIDKVLMGLRPSNLIILAARPSMGKTSLALNMAQNIATGQCMPGREARPVGIFSLEMSKEEIVLRMLCTEAKVSMGDVTGGFISSTGAQHTELVRAASLLMRAPIVLDDSAGLDISVLQARARRMKKKHDLQLIIVDYLQLLQSEKDRRQGRQVEVSAVSAGLKAMAKELKVPVLCLSQLSRAPEGRESGKPKLSDLRESGSIEQDADVVLLLRRPCRYPDDPDSNDPRLAIVDIAKHRNGKVVDDLKFNFMEEWTLFQDRDDHRHDEGGGGGA